MNPISPKLYAAAVGAGAGAVISQLLVWLIGAIISQRWDADGVDNAIAAVPSPLYGFILLLVTIAGAAAGAYIKEDPERLPTLGNEQRKRVGLVGVDVRPRRADLSENDSTGDVVR